MTRILAILAIALASVAVHATTWNTPGNYDSVQVAVNSASAGDTIHILEGTNTWTQTLTVNKWLIWSGAGTNTCKLIMNVNNPGGEPERGGLVLTGAGYNQVSGIHFSSDNLAAFPALAIIDFSGNNARVYNCKFSTCRIGVYIFGPFGVVDHNTFYNCHLSVRIYGVGNGYYNWLTYYPIAFSSLNYLFIENNAFVIDNNMPQNIGNVHAWMSSGQGSSYVARYNTFTQSRDGMSPCFDWHGDNNDGTAGNLSTQIYKNTFALSGTAAVYVFGDARGGQGLCYSNNLTVTPGYGNVSVRVTEEHPQGTVVYYPTGVPHLVTDVVTNQWAWENYVNGVNNSYVYCASPPNACAMTSFQTGVYLGSYAQPYPHPLTTNTITYPGNLSIIFPSMSIAETDGSITVTFLRRTGADGAVDCSYFTTDGTAVAPTDYTSTTGTLSWANGDTANKTIEVPVIYNGFTGSKTFTLTITNATGGATLVSPTTTTITIIGKPPPPLSLFSLPLTNISTLAVAGSVQSTVFRTVSGASTATVHYATMPGTAFAGTDYTSTSGDLTFLAGETNKPIVIPILNNPSSSTTRQFTLQLSNPGTNAQLTAPTSQTILIAPQPPPPPPLLASLLWSESELPGQAYIAQTLTGHVVRLINTTSTVTVAYQTINGTALAGRNYTAKSGSLSFAPGEVSKEVTVQTLADTTYRGTINFYLAIQATSTNAQLSEPATLLVILRSGGVPNSIINSRILNVQSLRSPP